jgi:hypothetical protein
LFGVVVEVAEVVAVPTTATPGLDEPPQPDTSMARPNTPATANATRSGRE